MKKKTVRKLELVLHFLTMLLLLIKGFDEISRRLYFPGGIITGLALIVLTILLFWKPLKIKPKQARIICYYVESPALLLTAYMLYLEQKEFLPHIFFIAGFMYPAVGFISSKKFKRLKKAAS
jgi:hypothetical protein